MKTRTSYRPIKRKLLVVALATSLQLLVVPMVSAQSADAALRGKAPPNSDVTVKNVATGLVRHAKTAADGSYALVGLPPGTYQVDAGPGTERTVTLTVASTATLDLAAGGTAAPQALEGVTVNATTLTEVKTSEVGTTISLRQIQTVPQITRNFLEFADTVPGMIFSVDPQGHTSLTGGAQNANSVNVYIDGVGQKNYVKEGGVSGQFATQGNPFPQLAIGEYKVITSNYKAEYDQISSAAVTAETKSGTNEFHGEVFDTYTDDSWRDSTPAEKNAGVKEKSQEKEYGFSLGGPIIQDTLHFFLTYEAKRFDTPITVVPGGGPDNVASLLPPAAAAELGPSSLPFTENLYFGKLDWEFSERDRIEASAKIRLENQADNIGTGQAESSSILVSNVDRRFDARWQHSGDNYFNELLATYEKSFNNPIAAHYGNGANYTDPTKNDQNILETGSASGPATQNKGQKGPALQDDLTFSNLTWYGDHTVKMGAKYKDVTLTAADAVDVNPQFYYDVTQAGTATIPYKVYFTSPVPGENPTAQGKDHQFGGYIQDDWVVNDHLTFNLGVRVDVEQNQAYEDYVTPANVIAAFNSQDPNAPAGQTYAQTLAKGGVNINNYISNGHNRGSFGPEWQPRLGFSYDLNGDEAHVIHGGAGRAYDRDLFDYLQVEQTKAALPQFTFYFPTGGHPCPAGSQCIAWDPKYLQGLDQLHPLVQGSNAGQEVDALNNNLKAPYSDQFSLGMRNKIGEWNTDATIARIESKDGFVFTLGNRYADGAFWKACGTGCISQPWGNGIPGFGSLIIGNNGIETRSTQVLLSADKPYTKESGWGATMAYTYTDAEHNRSITEHYAFDEETIKQYPFITSNAAPKHRFVATGTLDGPWGFLLSGKLTLATPIPFNDVANYGVVFPTGAPSTPIAAVPVGQSWGVGGKIWGEREIDFQTTKNFELPHDMAWYLRFELLNVFNYKNYNDILTNWGSNGVLNPDPVKYNPIGNLASPPRTFKFTIGFRF